MCKCRVQCQNQTELHADGKGAKELGKAAMKKGGLAKLNPGLKAFMKKKMAKKK